MAHTSAFPILLNDRSKVNGLRVHELKVALVSAGVLRSFLNSNMFCQVLVPRRVLLALSKMLVLKAVSPSKT
jgi:hypothetical protein